MNGNFVYNRLHDCDGNITIKYMNKEKLVVNGFFIHLSDFVIGEANLFADDCTINLRSFMFYNNGFNCIGDITIKQNGDTIEYKNISKNYKVNVEIFSENSYLKFDRMDVNGFNVCKSFV
jgi:hypothetical protein